MGFVRVVAVYKEGGHENEDYKIVILCHIDKHKLISDGEWFGYAKAESIKYPFILQRGQKLFYGDESEWFEPTNIGNRTIEIGSYFVVFNHPDATEPFEAVYEIESVTDILNQYEKSP